MLIRGLLTLALLLLLPAVSRAEINNTPLQATKGDWASGSTMVKAYAGATTAGSFRTISLHWGHASLTRTLVSVVGSGSGTWTCPAGANNALAAPAVSLAICYKENAAGTSDTVTATFSGDPGYGSIGIVEWSAVATSGALDQTKTNTQTGIGTTTDAVTTGTVVTTVDGELILAHVAYYAGTAPNVTAGTGFTCQLSLFSGSCPSTGDVIVESLVQGSAGTIASTWTNSNAGTNSFTSVMATFKPFVASTCTRSLLLLGVGGC